MKEIGIFLMGISFIASVVVVPSLITSVEPENITLNDLIATIHVYFILLMLFISGLSLIIIGKLKELKKGN